MTKNTSPAHQPAHGHSVLVAARATAAARSITALAALSAILLLSGCASALKAPGMQMGVQTSTVPATNTPEDIRGRADVYPLNALTVQRLSQTQAANEALARSKRVAAQELKYESYRVGHQDSLRVTVWNHPELTNPAGTANELAGRVVNGDGSFYFPFAGRVKAVGRTVSEIQADLAQSLARVLRDPQVEVAVLQYRSKKVYVAGEVKTPGAQPLTDVPLTVLDAVATAGGAGAEADLGAATLQRGAQTIQIDLNALYYGGDLAQNLRLQNNDVLTVPERRGNKVFVLGEVIKPASLLLPARGRLSLSEALADSGGLNPLSAHAGQVYVIRAGENDRAQIFHLDASTPESLVLADKFDLQRRDVVYVDTAPVVRWNRIISNILPTLITGQSLANDLIKGLPR
jgi:polysaccharide biosynthesis/export protein